MVPQDHAEAVKWYRKAADQGDVPGQFGLGGCYYYGWGVQQDYEAAYTWFSLAEANGDTSAPEYRDKTAKKLSPQAIKRARAQAQKLFEEIQARTRKP